MQRVPDVDEQRILWARGEKCVHEDECTWDVYSARVNGEEYMECYAKSLLASIAAAASLFQMI